MSMHADLHRDPAAAEVQGVGRQAVTVHVGSNKSLSLAREQSIFKLLYCTRLLSPSRTYPPIYPPNPCGKSCLSMHADLYWDTAAAEEQGVGPTHTQPSILYTPPVAQPLLPPALPVKSTPVSRGESCVVNLACQCMRTCTGMPPRPRCRASGGSPYPAIVLVGSAAPVHTRVHVSEFSAPGFQQDAGAPRP